jgi:hypothetical protein
MRRFRFFEAKMRAKMTGDAPKFFRAFRNEAAPYVFGVFANERLDFGFEFRHIADRKPYFVPALDRPNKRAVKGLRRQIDSEKRHSVHAQVFRGESRVPQSPEIRPLYRASRRDAKTGGNVSNNQIKSSRERQLSWPCCLPYRR